MNMDEIVEKRSQLLNFFFNPKTDVEYTKLDILNKEYSALSFSPREEFVDAFKTDYDDVLTPMEELETDIDEVLVKGVVVDVDMKKNYAIIHIQNKGWNISVQVDSNVLDRYSDCLQKGHLVLIKGHTYNGKVYMHFVIDYNHTRPFILEHDYLKKISDARVDDIDYTNRNSLVGLIRQVKYFKSKKSGAQCIRLQVYVKGADKSYISCNNQYSTVPQGLTAGMFISFKESNPPFVNNVQQTYI